jgi:hypothetical protein
MIRPRREKVFGPGRAVPLDRNAKARIMAYARAWGARHRRPGHNTAARSPAPSWTSPSKNPLRGMAQVRGRCVRRRQAHRRQPRQPVRVRHQPQCAIYQQRVRAEPSTQRRCVSGYPRWAVIGIAGVPLAVERRIELGMQSKIFDLRQHLLLRHQVKRYHGVQRIEKPPCLACLAL